MEGALVEISICMGGLPVHCGQGLVERGAWGVGRGPTLPYKVWQLLPHLLTSKSIFSLKIIGICWRSLYNYIGIL